MRLGLGLGFTGQQGSGGGAATPDWTTWDGTTDGPVTQLFTGGNMNGGDIVAVNETEAIYVWYAAGVGSPTKAVVLDYNESTEAFDPETTNAEIDILTGIGATAGWRLVKLSETRFLFVAEVTLFDFTRIVLIGKSGKTLSVLDTLTSVTGLVEAGEHLDLTALNSTQAACIWRDRGASNVGKVFIIDAAGDTLSTGTAVTTGLVTSQPGICRLTDSTFFMAVTGANATGNSEVSHCSVSGTTITVDAEGEADTISRNDFMIERISDTEAIVGYEVNATTYSCKYVQYTGSAVTFGTELSNIFDGNDVFLGSGSVTALPGRSVMFCASMLDETPRFGAAVVVTADDSGGLTETGRVQLGSDNNNFYVAVDATPSGEKVFYAGQNTGLSPTNQLDTRVCIVDGPTPNWAKWGGAENGTTAALGNNGSWLDVAATDSTEFVHVWRDSNDSQNTKAVVIDRDGTSHSAVGTNTAITLSTAASASGLSVERLTATRYLAIYEDASNNCCIALIGKDGKTLSELDTFSGTVTGVTTFNFRLCMSRLNDTQAVVVVRDEGDSDVSKVFVVDVASDTISIGAVLSGNDIIDFPAICGLTDSSFFYATQGTGTQGTTVAYCTVSGTTITQVDAAQVDGTTAMDNLAIGRISDNEAILSYERAALNRVDAVYVSHNGSAVSFGTPATSIHGGSQISQGTGAVTPLNKGSVMFVASLVDETPQRSSGVVVTASNTGDLIVGPPVLLRDANTRRTVIDAAPDDSVVFFADTDSSGAVAINSNVLLV